MTDHRSGAQCPSAQPDMPGARIFGLLDGSPSEPRIAYLKPSAKVDPRILRQLGPLSPLQVFRFAAPCEEHRCQHFDGRCCRLGARVATMLPPVVDALPNCQIRPTCRWYAEQGAAACLRCPQVVTQIPQSDDVLNRAATPDEPQDAGPTDLVR